MSRLLARSVSGSSFLEEPLLFHQTRCGARSCLLHADFQQCVDEMHILLMIKPAQFVAADAVEYFAKPLPMLDKSPHPGMIATALTAHECTSPADSLSSDPRNLYCLGLALQQHAFGFLGGTR